MKRKTYLTREVAFIPSREKIYDSLQSLATPVNLSRILELMKINDYAEEQALTNRINAMLRDGEIVKDADCYSINKEAQVRTLAGIALSREGYLFLQSDNGTEKIIPNYIARHLFVGDYVNLRLIKKKNQTCSQIISAQVLERKKTVVGKFNSSTRRVTSLINAINYEINICKSFVDDISDGLTVTVRLLSPQFLGQRLEGIIVKKCCYANATEKEINLAIQKFDLFDYWCPQALNEAKDYAKNIARIPSGSRRDLRDKSFITIDGQDAKDFDDAILVEEIDGRSHLFIAIADVAMYVPVGGAVDKEAYIRGNSVYFPSKVVPMLPQILSNEMCSLQPNQDRLAMVCEITLDSNGAIEEYRFYPAVIRSKARLTYTQVNNFLKKRKVLVNAEVSHMLWLAYRTWRTLDSARTRRKALQLNIPTTRIIFNDKKEALRVELYQRNTAHQLIEEFMICANVAAAKFLTNYKVPYLRRIHQGLKQRARERLNALLRRTKFGLREETHEELYQLFEEIKGHENEDLIHRATLKCLTRAAYAPLDGGHFGLALSYYTHFTSPIRRYPDLLVHRAIYSILNRNSSNQVSQNSLVIVGKHCSETERIAEDATRDIDGYLKCKLLQKSIGKRFNTTVSSVTNFGLFVELEGVYIDALVHISRLGDDYYTFDEKNQVLRSQNGKEVFWFGMHIDVKIIKVDVEKRRIDAIPA